MKKLFALFLVISFVAICCIPMFGQAEEPLEDAGHMSALILGDTSWAQFAVFWMFGLLGFIGSLLMDVYSSGEGMKDFSFRFWYKDNKIRVFISLFFITLFIIFSKELIELNVSNWSSLIIGFTIDKIMENFKQRKRNIVKKTEI